MTTTQTERLMALADRYAFHIPGSQHSDEARAALLAALQEQAPNPWKEAVLDQLAFHAMDAPINMPPADILKRIIDVSVTMATDPAITQQPVQAPKRLWGMAGFNPPLPNVGEKYTSIHEDDLGDHVTVTGIANASSPNIAYVFLSWDDGHYGERAIDEFWQEYMMVQTNDQAREGEAVAWHHGCNVLCADIDLWIDHCPHCGKPRPAAPAPQPAQPEQGERADLYSLDRDTEGIRARVVHAVLGVLAFGARNENKPPADHWLSELWEVARAERERKKFYRQDAMNLRDELNSLRELQSAQPVAQPLPLTDAWIRERTTQPWIFETVKQWVKEIEAAHGIGGAR